MGPYVKVARPAPPGDPVCAGYAPGRATLKVDLGAISVLDMIDMDEGRKGAAITFRSADGR